MLPSSSGLGHWPLTSVTGVRTPLGAPLFLSDRPILNALKAVYASSVAVWVILALPSPPSGKYHP
ncbi:hypothetical protein AFERRI_600149 [Acidithiobacillus ferrivorans]|uniref:Uncharacterized protein n=1 Tax=Acidithiobacillus ferrivorans TaxID=160808 RepID=A0A060UZ27_9PROT|nr:hypothetical protein AFERRI_600149 [Acidithiobacillus ferrivorans]